MGISPLGDNFAPSDVRNSQEVRSGQVEQTPPPQADRQRSRGSDYGADTVSLSSLGAELARSLATESADESRRVEGLQQALNNGTLQASSEETANRVIEEALQSDPASPRPGGPHRPASPV